MTLHILDWAIVAAFLLASLLVGLYYARRAGSSVGEFFLSGRDLPWWLVGTSMVATTFAADTPLAVTGFVARNGVAGNWVWWSFAIGGMLTVFLFARLWRRAGIMTDVELAELRYSGRPAAFLRGFRALYLGLPVNFLIIGWVNVAMATVLETMMGWSQLTAVLVCLAITGAYSSLSGLGSTRSFTWRPPPSSWSRSCGGSDVPRGSRPFHPLPQPALATEARDVVRWSWMDVAHHGRYAVDPASCIRCAACAILAPGVFEVDRRGSRLLRQPRDADERAGCDAAALICPTGAIAVAERE